MAFSEQAPQPDYLAGLNQTFGEGAAKIIKRMAEDNPLSTEEDVKRWAWELIQVVEEIDMPDDQISRTAVALQIHEFKVRYPDEKL
jgi:ActR/RegA family two-component response regulator